MSEQTQDLVQLIRQRLRAAVRRITLADLAYGLVLVVGALALAWLVATAVEAGFWLAPGLRAVVFWMLVAAALGLVGYFLVLPLLRLTGVLRGPSEEAVARQIGTRYPEVSDRLVNLLHLVEGRGSDAPAPLLDGAVRMLGEQVRPVPFEQVEDFRRARRAGRLASLPLVGLLVFLLVAPSTFLGASARLFSPGEVFQRPAPFALSVEPGSVDLVKGASLDVMIRAEGSELPQIIEFEYQNEDEERVETIRLAPEADGTFRHTFVNLRKTLRYRAAAAPVETPWYTARVTARPLVRDLQVALSFPRYTGIPPQQLVPNVGDVTALPGTRVAVEVGVGGDDVREAFLRFDDGRLDTLALVGDRAAGNFTLRRAGSYQILLRNGRGIENDEPITYALAVLADASPSVAILEPAALAELDESMQVGLRVRLNDDFGFARLRLYYRLAESRFSTPSETFDALDLPLENPRLLDQDLAFPWLLRETGLDPVPGDVIEYYVQVWDNDAVAGFKTARSATHRLSLASLAEKYEELAEEQSQTESEMEDLVRQTEEIQEQFKELRDELRRNPEGDWEDQRQLEQLQERQQNLEERVEDLTQQLDSMTDQMQENNLVDDETLEMYQELQRVSEEINSPELMEALKKLQESMQQLDLQQMQQSIENFEFNSEQYRQRLERTLDLFKRLQIEQQLDEAARRAEELAKQQERLQEETEKLAGEEEQGEESEGEREQEREGENEEGENQEGENSEGENSEGENSEGENQSGENQEGENQQGENQEGESSEGENQQGEQQPSPQGDQERAEALAQEQERSSEEMKALEEQMQELLEKMQEMSNMPQQQMEQLNEQTQQQQLPEQMQQNAEQLRQQQMQDAQQGQQQMQQQLQQMQQQLQQMQQNMQSQQQTINMAGMTRALNDILTLSQQQEALRGQVDRAAGDSPRLRDYAQRQIELSEGLRVVSDSLQSLAKDIPQMTRAVQKEAGEAQRAMTVATEALAERASRQAGSQQKSSMMHLNELALLLSDLMDQMMNASGSSGSGQPSMQQMLQQLQQMAGQQQKLNQQIQQMINDMQGNRLSQDAQQRLSQMAAQQEALRRQLKELGRNRELNNKALGDLNKIAEQMQETIQELQNQRAGRRTIQRQQQILTRLLDAQRSLQERGKEKRREGRTGDDAPRESPGELSPTEQAEQLRRALLRALESGYAPDYEELIKRYFELLQQER